MKKKSKMIELPDKVEIETFRDPRGFSLNQLKQDEPSCINFLSIRKFRVTVELIDEPVEVIQERIKKLWYECDNHHAFDSLKAAGKQYGIALDYNDFGKFRKKRSV